MGFALSLPRIPQQWRPLFMAVSQILQTKESQLEFLSKERKLLEDQINLQHQLWSQDLACFSYAIVKNERAHKKLKLGLSLEAARSDLVIRMKEKDALLYKLKLEYIESDLEDMKIFMQLRRKCSNKENIQSENKHVELAAKEDAQHELRRLKHEYERLSSQKETEVSALLSERDFVWNQLKRMEDEYIILIKRKCNDLDSAHVYIGNLEDERKKLQAAINEKDTIIANLNREIIECNDKVRSLLVKLSELPKNLEITMATKSALAASLDDHNFDTGEDGLLRVENLANKPGEVQDSDERQDEDVRSIDDLLVKLKEMSKKMEIKSIENENLRLLCSELKHQLNKQKNHLKNARGPKEVVSRNLIDELATASSKEGDDNLLAMNCCQQRKVLNKVEPPNGLVGSQTPEFEGEGTKVAKGSRSLSKKKHKKGSTRGRENLFSSAFKIPRLKASHSVIV
ncbi:unnamed protein product [Victoria cruziana]